MEQNATQKTEEQKREEFCIIENQKRKQFTNFLLKLAQNTQIISNDTVRSNIYIELEKLYHSEDNQNQFRHFYSDIFSVLSFIHDNPTEGSIQNIAQNIARLRNGYRPQQVDKQGHLIDITNSLKKLDDHISLDIARLDYIDKLDKISTHETKIKDLENKVTGLEEDITTQLNLLKDQEELLNKQKQDITNKIKEFNDTLNSTQKEFGDTLNSAQRESQRDHVTILGIFAAVVLAFTGGIAYSTSVLSNIHLVSTYKTIAVVLIIGLVLVNVLFCLFYYIDRIIKKDPEPKLKPFYFANIVLIILLVLIFIAWEIGIIEERNERLNNQSAKISAIAYQIKQNITTKSNYN